MKRIGELTVADYMADQAIVVNDNEKLTHAIGLMEKHRLNAIPVVDSQGALVGILSTTDLIEMTHEIQSDIGALTYVSEKTRDFLVNMLIERGDTTFLRDLMTSPVDTISENTNLVVAARKLVERGYHHLPVVDDSARPIGILSAHDVVRAFAEHAASRVE